MMFSAMSVAKKDADDFDLEEIELLDLSHVFHEKIDSRKSQLAFLYNDHVQIYLGFLPNFEEARPGIKNVFLKGNKKIKKTQLEIGLRAENALYFFFGDIVEDQRFFNKIVEIKEKEKTEHQIFFLGQGEEKITELQLKEGLSNYFMKTDSDEVLRWVLFKDIWKEKKLLEARLQLKDAEVFARVSTSVSTKTDYREILFSSINEISKIAAIKRASIIVSSNVRPQETAFVVASSDNPALEKLGVDLKDYPEVREVLRTKKKLFVRDVAKHPLLENIKEKKIGKISPMAIFPIVINDESIGVLFLRFFESDFWLSEYQKHLCQIVANGIAYSLENTFSILELRETSQMLKEEKKAALRQVEELGQFKGFFDALAHGVLAINDKNEILYANQSALSILKMTLEELKKSSIEDFVRKEDRHKVGDVFSRTRRGEEYPKLKFQIVNKDGEKRILNASFARLSASHHVIVSSFRDVTKEEKLFQDWQKAQEELQKVEENKLLTELAGATAHELNQPLMVISGNAEMVKKLYPDNHEIMKRASNVLSEVDRMAKIIKRLSELTHYERKNYIGNETILDINKSSGGE